LPAPEISDGVASANFGLLLKRAKNFHAISIDGKCYFPSHGSIEMREIPVSEIAMPAPS
jgi:hypothetical protein